MNTSALWERANLINLIDEQDRKDTEFRNWLKQYFGSHRNIKSELIMHLEDYWWNKHDKKASFGDTFVEKNEGWYVTRTK